MKYHSVRMPTTPARRASGYALSRKGIQGLPLRQSLHSTCKSQGVDGNFDDLDAAVSMPGRSGTKQFLLEVIDIYYLTPTCIH